jgi:type VI secretion system secreted protein VgrG
MAGSRKPGPLGTDSDAQEGLDAGTLARTVSPMPGPLRGSVSSTEHWLSKDGRVDLAEPQLGSAGGSGKPAEPVEVAPPPAPVRKPVSHSSPAPKAPETKPEAYKSGLGDKADKIINQSPTLKKNLEQLQKNGWTVKVGDAGKGTFADRDKKTITVDANDKDKPATLAQSLAHETGHALYEKDPYVPPTGLTKEDYVSKNVNASLKDEGEATMMNMQVRDEIKKNGGPDIGIAGTQGKKYQEIADKYPDAKDRDKARQEIGDVFAGNEHPSNDATKTYKDYYSKPYEDYYDKTTSPAKKP